MFPVHNPILEATFMMKELSLVLGVGELRY